jgi:uncharacterized membrane protein
MISVSHIHPMLVHFPIALVVFGFAADIFSLLYKKEACLSTCGFYLLLIGTLSALITLLSGIFFTSDMSGSAGEIMETHELFAWTTVGILIVTSVLRVLMKTKNNESTKLKWTAFVLYGIAAISVSITGFFGGTLVYNYMMPL